MSEYILLKNEELLSIDLHTSNGMIDIPVIKRTPRTRRMTAKLTVGSYDEMLVPPDNLLKIFSSPNVKKQMNHSDELYEWIRHGWVIREYRFEKDERTVKSERYRMGYNLFGHQTVLKEQEELKVRDQFLKWRDQWLKQKSTDKDWEEVRLEALQLLKNKLDKVARAIQQGVDTRTDTVKIINSSWRLQKQLRFLHFLSALYNISSSDCHFDWKQIGASYYKRIGGSKEFDVYKKDFIKEAENILGHPLHLLGLASLGTITPIFFTGPMKGHYASYDYGSVHSTTDLAAFTDSFQTNAKILWLVENRGILTRMAFEKDFLIESNSLILGVDGQLRSGHERLIESLVPSVEQVIIWTDVDEAGLTIANELTRIVDSSSFLTKWVVPPLEIVTNWCDFEKRFKVAINKREEEQEQDIGGVIQWKKWINH